MLCIRKKPEVSCRVIWRKVEDPVLPRALLCLVCLVQVLVYSRMHFIQFLFCVSNEQHHQQVHSRSYSHAYAIFTVCDSLLIVCNTNLRTGRAANFYVHLRLKIFHINNEKYVRMYVLLLLTSHQTRSRSTEIFKKT